MTIAFNPEAESYDKWYTSKAGAFIDLLQTTAVFDLLMPQKEMRILDVGCGTGNYSLKLKNIGCEVVGVDVSEKMLDIFKLKLDNQKTNIELHLLQSNTLPFEDESFDAVISVTAVEFMNNLNESIDEMFRVLKPNCSLVIGTLHKESKWGAMYESDFFKSNTVFKYANLLGKKDLLKLHTNQFVEFNESVFFPPNTDENLMNQMLEEKFKKTNNGGFLSALWKK